MHLLWSTVCFRSAVSCLAAFIPLAALRAEEATAPATEVAVSVGKIIRTTLHSYVTAYGKVESAPAAGSAHAAGGARLSAASSGLVVSVPVEEGARVGKSAVLVQLDARAANAAVDRAQAMVVAAEKAVARQSRLQAADGTSERAWQEAQERLAAAKGELAAAQLQQTQLTIRSPINGVIVWLSAKPGEWLDTGSEVAEVVDPDRLTVAAHVSVEEAAVVKAGQAASIFSRLSQSEMPLSAARLEFVSPRVVAGTHQVAARLSLPTGSGLRAGQFVSVRIVTDEHAGCLAVPLASVYIDSEGHAMLSVVESRVARQKSVQVGFRDGGVVEVSGEGLAEGMTVVTGGSYALPKETKVRILTENREAGK